MSRLWSAIAICCEAGMGQAGTCTDLRTSAEALPEMQGSPLKCTVSRTLGQGASDDCHWSFAFRDAGARASFEALSDLVAACADAPLMTQGARVNHPDSFDQATGRVKGRAVSVSLKDKGGLGQTLVFLRQAREKSLDQ
jgi:hypothetical protein